MTILLKGITWDHPRGYQPLAVCSEQYASKSDVSVEWHKRSLKDFGDQPIEELVETYDLLIIDHPHVGVAASTGCLLPLDEYLSPPTLQELAEQSAGPSHASYHYDGHQWGLALDTAMQASVYRADLLDAPLPADWSGVIALGEQTRQQGMYIAIPLAPTDAICSFLSLCASLGEIPGEGGRLVSAAAGQRALTILSDIKRVAHPDCLSWNPIAMLDYMSSADDVVYCPLTFNYTNYSRDGYQPHVLTFTSIPGIKGSILGGAGFAISAHCKHPQAASELGAWLCGAAVQSGCYVREGGQPGNITAWQSPEANKITTNFFKNTLPTLEQSFIRPRHHGFPTFQEAAGNIIHRFLQNGSAVEACFQDLTDLYHTNQ